jgi:hypothetical protein
VQARGLSQDRIAPERASIHDQPRPRPKEYSGIIGPDGQPVSATLVAPRPLVTAVTAVNDELVERIAANPEEMRTLPSPKFEELVAELLIRQGYEVELTPPSRDGGFDMYAARHEALGKFLYLVECKRYGESRPVGVEVVRALQGVVYDRRANAGVIATTSYFTSPAKSFQAASAPAPRLRRPAALARVGVGSLSRCARKERRQPLGRQTGRQGVLRNG